MMRSTLLPGQVSGGMGALGLSASLPALSPMHNMYGMGALAKLQQGVSSVPLTPGGAFHSKSKYMISFLI